MPLPTVSRRQFGVLALGALAAWALPGCSLDGLTQKSETASSSGALKTLRIGAQPYPLYSPVYVARDLGYLEAELRAVGATYTWNEFGSGPLVNEAMAGGNLDIGFMADLPAIIARSTGQDIEVFCNIQYGGKGLAVLVPKSSPIQTISDLKDKKVAYATGSYAEHLLALLLANQNLSLSDVKSVNLSAADQAAALRSGDVDAIVIWEQYISQLTREGVARIVADGTGVKRGNMITYAATKYAQDNPSIIRAYVKALSRADELITSSVAKVTSTLAKDFKVDETLMPQILAKFTYTNSLSEDDIKEITSVKNFAFHEGIIKNDFDINSFITSEYLTKAS